MGTIIDKLRWLINRKKELVDIVNSKTNIYNSTGSSRPFSGTYSNPKYTDIVKETACLYPLQVGEIIMSRMYSDTTIVTSCTNYLRYGLTFSITQEATGIYNCSISRSTDLHYAYYYVHVGASHEGSNYNNPLFASVLYTSNVFGSSPTTFKIYTADDNSLNSGTFTITVYAIGPDL